MSKLKTFEVFEVFAVQMQRPGYQKRHRRRLVVRIISSK